MKIEMDCLVQNSANQEEDGPIIRIFTAVAFILVIFLSSTFEERWKITHRDGTKIESKRKWSFENPPKFGFEIEEGLVSPSGSSVAVAVKVNAKKPIVAIRLGN